MHIPGELAWLPSHCEVFLQTIDYLQLELYLYSRKSPADCMRAMRVFQLIFLWMDHYCLLNLPRINDFFKPTVIAKTWRVNILLTDKVQATRPSRRSRDLQFHMRYRLCSALQLAVVDKVVGKCHDILIHTVLVFKVHERVWMCLW